jgi:acetoin utilization protein AcuC
MVFDEIIEPVAKEFKPQTIIRNGGSDPHFSDHLTNLNLTIEGFKMIGEKVRKLAEISQGKEIDLIASGYNLKVLNSCWTALISKLLGLKIEVREPIPLPKLKEPIEEVNELIKKIKKEFKKYWRLY